MTHEAPYIPRTYPGQRILRTLFTTVLSLLPVIPQVVAIIQGQWSAEFLTVIAAQSVAINTALTAIIAIPTVNEFLTYVGLGSVPRSVALN